jgi:anti-sigma regulatory factor (Ser/Thr protein kinase)
VERTDPPGFFEAQLPAELSSVVAARRLVRSAGEAWGVDSAPVGDAALAVSELAANAVLHACTPMRVTVRRLGKGMRIEVEDGNVHLPVVSVARPEDLLENRTMSGRGLALVAAMADRWGADPAAGGKVTWAEVGTGRRVVAPEAAPKFPPALPASTPRMAVSAPAPVLATAAVPVPATAAAAPVHIRSAAGRAVVSPLPTRALSSAVTASALTGGGRTVQLIGVPVALLVESNRHLADLQRELEVIARDLDRPADMDAVIEGGRCLDDIDCWTTAEREPVGAALATREHRFDYQITLPADVHDLMDRFVSWLHRLAGSLAQKHMLTQPASDGVMAYREWYRDEVLSQLAGSPPRPCPLEVPAPV